MELLKQLQEAGIFQPPSKEVAEEGDFDVERMPGGVISAEEMVAEEIKELY